MYKSLERTIMEMGRPKVQPIVEDGHQDVASAKNKVKIAMSALQKMQGELNKLSDEDDLPSWWMGKVAIAVDKIDGMADYLDTQVEELQIDEGYEKEVLLVLKDAGISGSFRSGRLYVDKQDVKDARSALKDSDNIRSLPRIIGEEVEIDEGMMKNMAIDLKDLPADEFQRKYNMSKAEAERKFGKPEVKSAPKGYHFTRDGKLKKGDADADGDGGAKLRSDPLDKQRSKIPPLPEKIEEARDPSMSQVMAVMAPTKNAQEGVAAIMKAFKVDEKKAMKLLDAAIKDVLGESMDEQTLDELSIMTLNRYYKKALAAIHKSRKSHDASILRGMDPSKDKATISKRARGVNLAKSRALKKIRGEDINEKRLMKGIDVDDDTLRMFKANPKMVPNSPAFRRLDPKTQNAVKRHLGMREDVNEKTLTPAEKKKREEVAKAIERENPNMPMDQKMAIATATAKKVAEDVQTEPATNTSLFHNYIQKLVKGEV